MLVDIDKIKVGDRIRKDFGDIEELADNIKRNGLFHPLTVNGDFKLLAGERRYRACKSLGWQQVDVHMVNSEDEAQDLEIEISENNVRRNFTGSELAEGLRRQMAIEQEKAKKRQDLGTTLSEGTKGRAREKAGEAFGISGTQVAKVLYVSDNADMLDPADFADWDEGKLSTNKAFQRIKAAKDQAERNMLRAQSERDSARSNLEEAYRANAAMEQQVAFLKRQIAEKPKPEVVEKIVPEEVVPKDYEAAKKKVRDLEHERNVYLDTDKRLREQLEATRKELDRAKDILGMDKTAGEVRKDVQYLISATNGYVRRYGGLTWTVQQLNEVDEATLDQLRKAVRNLVTFSSTLMRNLESMNADS